MKKRRYKKPYRAKRKKPFFYSKSFWFFTFFLFLGGGLAWFLCFSPVFEVKMVEVSGDGKVNNGECQKIIEGMAEKRVAFLSSKSIFLFDLDRASREILSKFPQIQNINIQRKFPGEIYASLEERKPAATFNWRDSRYFSIDESGVIFEESRKTSDSFELKKNDESGDVKAGDKVFDSAFLVKILRFKADGENKLGLKFDQGLVVTDERVNFKTKEGWEIFINPQKDIDWQFTKLDAVVLDESFKTKRSELEYVDLRFTRVYLKTKQAAQTIEVDSQPGTAPAETNQTPVNPGAILN
jgi:cell division septal protein FtsQ